MKNLLPENLQERKEALEIMSATCNLLDLLCCSSLSEEDDQKIRNIISHMVQTNR